jgi:hypothetical protein
MDNIRNLLARNLERTLPEQIQYAYLTLLGKLEEFSADVLGASESTDLSDEAREQLEWVHQNLTRMISKNVRLRHKVLHNPQAQ